MRHPTTPATALIEGLEPRQLLATFTVTNTNDDGAGSLRRAVELANDAAGADVVRFSESLRDSTISLDSGSLFVTDALSINADDTNGDSLNITVTANERSRHFYISDSQSGDVPVSISGLTLTEGELSDEEGGSIYSLEHLTLERVTISHSGSRGLPVNGGAVLSRGPLTVRNSVFTDNFGSGAGGAIFALSSLVIEGSTFTGNRTYEFGGAVHLSGSGAASISGSTFTGNSSTTEHGGAIFVRNRTLTITDSTIDGNSADAFGGGVYVSDSSVSISQSTLSANTTGGNGGAIFASSGTVTIADSTLSDNTAAYGGAVFQDADASLTITNTAIADNTTSDHGGGVFSTSALTLDGVTVTGNTSARHGGGIYSDDGSLAVTDSTFSNNHAESYGGAIRASDSPVTITGSTFSANTSASYGGTIYLDGNSQTHAISDSTFDGNSAVRDAGALYVDADETTSVTVTNVSFTGNTARYGGAVYIYDASPLYVLDSAFVGNSSARSGGALYSDAPLSIARSTFRANEAGTDQASLGYGGAIYTSDDNVTAMISDSLLEDNTAEEQGGAIYRRGDGGLTVTGTTIRSNTAPDGGGGIYNDSGTLTIIGSVIRGNDTTGNDGRGGGIYHDRGGLVIRNSTISGNAGGDGGGIFTDTQTTSIAIIDSAVDDNSSTSSGGGIHAETGANIDIVGSSLSRNRAESRGGGIYLLYPASTTILNTTISTNSAQSYGGGLFVAVQGFLVSIASSTIANNHANSDAAGDDPHGGGIYIHNETGPEYARLESTIVAGNLTGSGDHPDEIFVSAFFGFDPDTGGSNLVQDADTAGGITGGQRGNIVGADPLLGDLRDNGGGRLTHALLTGSPAIDAGSNPYGEGFDQRGRFFVRAKGQADIGAYERQALTLTVDTNSDASDGDYSEGDLSLREAIAITNANPLADTITFHDSLTNTRITLTGGELLITDDLAIDGLGREVLAIDAGNASRHLRIDDGDDGSLSRVFIRDIRLLNGADTDGGSIHNSEDLTLAEMTIDGNHATGDGGAIFNRARIVIDHVIVVRNSADGAGGAVHARSDDSHTTVTRGLFRDNTAAGDGGAIDHDAGELLIDRTRLERNASGARGGALATNRNVTLDGATFIDNTAEASGGAIFAGVRAVVRADDIALHQNTARDGGAIDTRGDVSLQRADIYNNSAEANGGGIRHWGGDLDLIASSLVANHAGADGGGVWTSAFLRLINVTVSTNTANGSGGGIEMRDGSTGIYGSTIALNRADNDNDGAGSGGGIRIGKDRLFGQAEISISIIALNTAGDSPSDIATRAGGQVQSSSGSNLIGDPASAGGLIDGQDGNIVGADPRLGVIGLHGGKTRVHPLLYGSPAIDAVVAPEFLATDQRGLKRPFGERADIGAFEYQPVIFSLSVIDGGLVRATSADGNTHRFVIRNADGELVVFESDGDGWIGRRLVDLTGAPDPTGDATIWTDPKDGLTYVAGPSTAGFLLFVRDAEGRWTYRNLSAEIEGAAGDSPVRALTQFVSTGATGRVVIVAGLSESGELVAFQQTGQGAAGAWAWRFVNISDDLAAQRMTTPAFSELISYVTPWNAWTIAGIDADGNIQGVWVAPASFTAWRVDNLSRITGAPPISGQLTVTQTSWSAINLGGVDDRGHLVVTWWIPRFKGDWVTSDLTRASGGETLVAGRATGFVTPWGAINYAGINAAGDVAAYWWTPQSSRWDVTPLTARFDAGEGRPAGTLTSHVSANGTMSVLGATEQGDITRVWWAPNDDGRWKLTDLTEITVRG